MARPRFQIRFAAASGSHLLPASGVGRVSAGQYQWRRKWTFPKGAPERSMSHSQAAEERLSKRPAFGERSSRGTFTSICIRKAFSGGPRACASSWSRHS